MASSPSSVATDTMSDEFNNRSKHSQAPIVPMLDIGHGSVSDEGSFSDFDDSENSDYESGSCSTQEDAEDVKESLDSRFAMADQQQSRNPPQTSSGAETDRIIAAMKQKYERVISINEEEEIEKQKGISHLTAKQSVLPVPSGLPVRVEEQSPTVNPLAAMMKKYENPQCFPSARQAVVPRAAVPTSYEDSEEDSDYSSEYESGSGSEDSTDVPPERIARTQQIPRAMPAGLAAMMQQQQAAAARPPPKPSAPLQTPRAMPAELAAMMQQQQQLAISSKQQPSAPQQAPRTMPAGLAAMMQQQQAAAARPRPQPPAPKQVPRAMPARLAAMMQQQQQAAAAGASQQQPSTKRTMPAEIEESEADSDYSSEYESGSGSEESDDEVPLQAATRPQQAPRSMPAGLAAMMQQQHAAAARPQPQPPAPLQAPRELPAGLAAMMQQQEQQQVTARLRPHSSAPQQAPRAMPAGLAAMMQQQQTAAARTSQQQPAVPRTMPAEIEESEEDSNYSSEYESGSGSGESDEEVPSQPHQASRSMPAGLAAMMQQQQVAAARPQPQPSAPQQEPRAMPPGPAAMRQQQQQQALARPQPHSVLPQAPRVMPAGLAVEHENYDDDDDDDCDSFYSSEYDSESEKELEELSREVTHLTSASQAQRGMPAGLAAMMQQDSAKQVPQQRQVQPSHMPVGVAGMMQQQLDPQSSTQHQRAQPLDPRNFMMNQHEYTSEEDTSDFDSSYDSDESEEDDDFDVNDSHFTPDSFLQQAAPSSNPMSLEAMLQDYDDNSYSEDEMSCSESSAMYSTCSSGSSSDFDEEYEELMASMPFGMDNNGSPTRPPPRMPGPTSAMMPQPSQGGTAGLPQAPPTEGLDLSMLNSLRSELEKVGNMINKQGSKFVQRAHILASINMLAANLPACVVEHLGQEIRDQLSRDEHERADGVDSSGDAMSVNVSEYSDDTSELSYGYMDDAYETAGSVTGSLLLPSEQEVARRKRNVRHIRSDVSNKAEDSESKSQTSLQNTLQTESRKKTGNLDKFLGKRRGSIAQQAMYHCTTASMVSDDDVLDVLPATAAYDGALMFVDISGFTKLSTVLDPEGLSKVINSYFQRIVDKVYEFHGDIQKFAGDALFAEWRVSGACTKEECVVEAAACAASMIKDCADFPVLALVSAREVLGSNVTSLNIHCGLGVGKMTGLHVGDSTNRREYLYIGDAIDQATQACDTAKLGQAVASQEFYDALAGICERTSSNMDDDGTLVVANRNFEVFNTSKIWDTKKNIRNAKSRGVTDQVDGLEADALIEYRRLMSLYVHPVVVSNDTAAANDFNTSKTVTCANERHREEAELRSVYVMFIMLKLPVEIRGAEGEGVHLLNDTMNLVTKKLKHYSGHLRQFIVDDKGFVMIATFGLRGSTFPNMVSERALPATLLIHQSLHFELGISCKIGATFGDVYCGAVGGEKRHEYAVMGPSVNLAARLMASPDNPGILVDQKVRQLSTKSYCFNALAPINAKGYAKPVAIFEPLSHAERTWGKVEAHFVGRQDELAKLMHMAEQTMRTPYPESKLVLIHGESGMGKTTLLSEMIERITRKMGKSEGLVIAKHIGLDSEMLVPFATFGNIFTKVLSIFADLDNDDDREDVSFTSRESGRTTSCGSTAATTVTVSSGASTMSASAIVDALTELGKELGAPAAVVDHATKFVLETTGEVGNRKGPSKRAIASFFSHAFLRCIEEVKLVIVAIDDIHRTDEMSWSVLRKVLENAGNVMMIGTSSLEKSSFRISGNFWDEIDADFTSDGRFVELSLETLSEEDVAAMTMKKLGLQEAEVSSDLLHEVVVQSGGMPHFANQILDNIKEQRESGKSDTGVSQKKESLAEIILHRVDTFDLAVRSTLNIGAVLGDSFTLGEVVAVLLENKDAKEKDIRPQVVDSLKMAVREGILTVGEEEDGSCKSETSNFGVNDDATKFTFFQVVWRTTLLGLMLASRKRDVHRKTAQSMEAALDNEKPVDYRVKLFQHWSSSGSTSDSTRTALDVGKLLERSPRLMESIQIYEETLSMFGWIKEELHVDYGFCPELLEILPEEEVKDIVELSVSLGRAQELAHQFQIGANMYENALHVMKNAAGAAKLTDRSIIFPAFTALSNAIAEGRVKQDVYCRYEQSMIDCFIKETRVHGRLIHHIQALYLQMVLYSRLGHNDKAIAVQSVIREIYKPELHSKNLYQAYGMDSGAISFSFCAHLHMAQGDRRKGLKICRRVLKDIVPIIQSDFDQAFFLVFPLLFVLKDAGFPLEALQVFETLVLKPLGDRCQSGKYPFLERIFEPLGMLFTLSGKDEVGEEKLHEYSKWCVDATNLLCGERLNLCLGRMGRCGDSISAEVCLQLAMRLPKECVSRKNVLTFGSMVASNAITFNRKNSLKFALKKLQEISSQLKSLGRNIKRRSSIM